MTITLDIRPELEKELHERALARGVSLTDYLQEIVVREAHLAAEPGRQRRGQELVDACAKVRGLLTDEETDTLFSRNPSLGRPVDFE
jgi:hypothetical protein